MRGVGGVGEGLVDGRLPAAPEGATRRLHECGAAGRAATEKNHPISVKTGGMTGADVAAQVAAQSTVTRRSLGKGMVKVEVVLPSDEAAIVWTVLNAAIDSALCCCGIARCRISCCYVVRITRCYTRVAAASKKMGLAASTIGVRCFGRAGGSQRDWVCG